MLKIFGKNFINLYLFVKLYKVFFYITILFINFAFLKSSLAIPPNLSQKHLLLKSEFNYLNTDSNFDRQGGSIEDLPTGNSYNRMGLRGSAFYTFANNFAFDLGLEGARAESIKQQEERTQLQLTEFHGKLNYQWLRGTFELIPEFGLIVPFNSFDETTDETLTGEGVYQATLGSWWVWDFSFAYIYGFLAYNYRADGRSHLLPWKLGIETEWRGFYLGTEAYGYESITDDEFVETPNRRETLNNRVNGGSFTFHGINPQQIAIQAWAGLDITNDLQTRIGYSQSINGTNSGVDQIIYANVQLRFDMSQNVVRARYNKTRETQKSLRNFKVEEDKYEENLFDPNYQRIQRRKKLDENQMLNETEKLLENK